MNVRDQQCHNCKFHSAGNCLNVDGPYAGQKVIENDWCGMWREGVKPQEAKADNGKPRLSLVPMKIVWDIAEVREYGCKKYHDPLNWLKVEPERYREALLRHVLSYIDDPDGVDKESGLPHLYHAACNVAFLCALRREE